MALRRTGVPRRLERICLKALEAEPGDRYPTAEGLAEELERFLRGPRRAALIALTLIPLIGVGAWIGTQGRRAPIRAGSPTQPDQATATSTSLEATLTVRHYRKGDRPGLIWSLGEFGEKTASARFGDVARVEARFSAPAYFYLLALNPDGSVQLCEPADPRTAPTVSALLSFPPGEEDYFGFTDGKGLQAFVLVASRHPLPPFADWAAGRALSWSSLPAAGVWSFDGHRWEPRSGPDAGSRGQIVHLAGVPTPLAEACRRLTEAPGVEIVRAVALPVE
jgi:hypothetical protein